MYSNFVCISALSSTYVHILLLVVIPSRRLLIHELAGAGFEANGGAVDAHLERALLHVAEDGHATVTAAGCEREAPERQDPVGAQRHGRAAAEGERHVRERHGAVPGEVVAGVQDPVRRRCRVPVRGHAAAERGPQRRVRGRRQAGDDRAGVHHRPARERRRGHAELLPADADPRQHDDVVGRRVRRRQQLRRGEARRGARRPAHAQREVPRGGRLRREAVGEDPAVGARRLLHERRLLAAEAQEPVDAVEQPALRVPAAEEEALHRAARRQGQRVGAVHARGVGPVAVADHVPALRRRAGGRGVDAQPRAHGAPARHGGVGRRLGGVEERVLLAVARRRRGARLALHPRQVAAGVHLHGLRHARRAEARRHHVVERADVVPPARRHRRHRRRRLGVPQLRRAPRHPPQYVLRPALVRAQRVSHRRGR
jgi:hypothetical protein